MIKKLLGKVSFIWLLLLCVIFIGWVSIVSPFFSTPQKTLDRYIRCINENDSECIRDSFYPPLIDLNINIAIPLIESYKVVKKISYKERERDGWNSTGIIPKSEIGDIELQVIHVVSGKEQAFSYLLRKIDGEWKIIAVVAKNGVVPIE